MTDAPTPWRRLSPRMLLVHPLHEVLRQLPLLIGSVVLGTATGNPLWSVAALTLLIAVGLARWFTTAYRIADDHVERREGVLARRVLSLPRNRIRSVSTDARVLHRLLGLTVVTVSTGQEGRGDTAFALDAVRVEEVAGLRALLLPSAAVPADAPDGDRVLARWQPSWLRFGPLSFTGLAMIAAALGVVYQTGVFAALRDSPLVRAGLDATERAGVVVAVGTLAGGVLLASVVLSVLRSLVTYGDLVLSRSEHVLRLEHGLLRRRQHAYDTRRLRGGTLREPLLVRLFGGARLDAVMTGVGGSGEASLLLPPCPRDIAGAVLAELTDPDAAAGPLREHGPAARRRRWTRALLLPAAVAVVLLVSGAPGWTWAALFALTVCCGGLAHDRSRALGHRVDADWLVARAGSVDRRRDCIAAAGVIGWTVRQTPFQRRAGVATLVAATAAGVKGYRVLDVPAERAWQVAATASPWVAGSEWLRG